LVGLLLGSATVALAALTAERGWGLLAGLDPFPLVKALFALLTLDAWMYLWHQANHRVPWLWRFHRMHHSDLAMDVTTATRFHLGEQVQAALVRLLLIPVLGWEVGHLLTYDALLLIFTQFHHADISLGRADRWLRGLIITPDLHKVHHSPQPAETNANYSVILSIWDRLGQTFFDPRSERKVEFGLDEFRGPEWQTLGGLLRIPFAQPDAPAESNPAATEPERTSGETEA